jgi:endonuclease III
MPRKIKLPAVIDRLSEMYTVERALADPFLHILWDNIGYLIDDDRRAALFDEFQQTVGFDPAAILSAPDSGLLAIARKGGMNPDARVERWREIAGIVVQECRGDLSGFLRTLPPARARAFLKRFPAVGDSAADRVLLFCDLDVRPSVDSNGLRVLVRLGLVPLAASYAATYKTAVATIAQNAARGRDWLMACHTLLREHGRNLCKRNNPRCIACPLDSVCTHAPAKGL